MLLFLLIALTTSCSLFKPIPDSLSISINTATDLNPDSEGRSSPIVLRIYELSDMKAFKEKDFFDIFDNDKESLTKSLVKLNEIELNPNESRKLDINLNSSTKYIGFLAAYRDIDQSKWREIAALTSQKPSGVPVYGTRGFTVDLNKNKITIVSNK